MSILELEEQTEVVCCKNCGNEKWWVDCPDCGGEGYHELYDEDPLWYDPDDTEDCSTCAGDGGWLSCPTCLPEAFSDRFS